MTTFYICRHGQTENNRLQRFSGWIDTPLTDAGVQNALTAATKLAGIPIGKIIASDLGRAFITAYLIAQKLGYTGEIGRAKALREVNYGDFANQPYRNYPVLTPQQNTHFTPPNGESLAHMQQRVVACVRQLAADNPDATILLVAHDGTINALRASFTGEEMGVADRTHHSHDFVGTFTLADGKVTSFEEVGA